MLTSGQLELNNYVNTDAKYTKFAYSSRFGFTIERGCYGVKHAACDSMLLLADDDEYYGGRRECEAVEVHQDYILSRWSPWHDVHITTWLIACGEWHLRMHKIDSGRALKTVEEGFAVLKAEHESLGARGCRIHASNDTSATIDLSPQRLRRADSVVTPPNSSIMFAGCASISMLMGDIPRGESWLCCAVVASGRPDRPYSLRPDLTIDGDRMTIIDPQSGRTLTLSV